VFVRALSAAGLANPVVLLDELDKLSTGQRGDPHAALLEILDPVRGFRVFDRYLQLEVDLSDVLFIATANDIRGIHPALQSRLEIVEFLGYDLYEKHQIARKYLWAKCLERCGLDATRIQLLDSALPLLIRQYTREAGVRDLDKRLDELCRQIAHKAAGGLGQKQIAIDDTAVAQYLGPSLFFPHSEQRETMVGRAHAAAITEAGSAVYPIDCATMASDQARLTITGEQGSSGQEPCELALSLLQSRTALGAEKAGSSHFHVHLEGGIRSLDEMKGCGAAILLSMVSSLREKPLPQDTAVLGELSLLGEVRGVARLHAKILTAQRFGVRHLLLPVDNKIDVHHLPAHTTEEMNFEFVSDAEELVTKAFA